MSTVNIITAMQSSILSMGKAAASKTIAAQSALATTSPTDSVALSSAGIALAADESNMAHAKTPAQERLIRAASSDRASAEKIAYDMASARSTIFYDIRGQAGVGDGKGEFVRKLASTGEIVDDNYVNKFKDEAAIIDAQRLAIYESEKEKGTDPLQILIKMLDFTNVQSQDYLEATGWGYQGSSPP